MEKRKVININGNYVGGKISECRRKAKMTQAQLGETLGTALHQKAYSISLISAWESGRKTPSIDQLYAISELFSISVTDLIGEEVDDGVKLSKSRRRSSDRVVTDIYEIQMLQEEQIPPAEYKYFDRKPVYVCFSNKKYKDQWGIVNYDQGVIIIDGGKIKFTNGGVELYPLAIYDMPTYHRRYTHPLSMDQMLRRKQVWVEMNSSDDAVRSEWNGWYIFNNARTALINVLNGNPLPLRCFGKTFRAYADPYDIVDKSLT